MSFLQSMRSGDFWNPFEKRGGYVIPHVMVLLLVALLIFSIGFVSGWQAGSKYTAAYFASRYSFPGIPQTPALTAYAPIPYVGPSPSATQGSVDRSIYPSVGDQGPLGACAAWSTALTASFEYRRAHPGSWMRYSPRCIYDGYSNTYSGGQDGGSWPDQNLDFITQGDVSRFKDAPYGLGAATFGMAAYIIDHPTWNRCIIYGGRYQTPFSIHALTGFALGAGRGAVDATRATLAGLGTSDGKAHPVLVAFEVYPEYDAGTQQPLVVGPPLDANGNPTETSRGGHENTFLAYDDQKQMPDGTLGAFLTQNQWSKRYGDVNNTVGAGPGRIWLSYSFVERWTFGLEYITLGASAPKSGPVPPWDTGMQHAPKIISGAPTAPPTATSGWYVHDVYAQDRRLNLAPIINAVGDKVGLWPVGLTSTLRAECALYTTSPQCDRYGPWPDWSHGACQVSVQTAGGFGVGYGNEGSDSYVKQYENNPWNCIKLGARVMKSYINYTGVGYPYAEVGWNCGPFRSAYQLYNPYSVNQTCGDNFQHYLPSYYWALAHVWHPK